jgi:3-methyladenine DNA glycosylase AlkD
MLLTKLRKELRSKANAEKARILQGFFKTGKGEYGEGDVFLGITTPENRKIALKYKNLGLAEIKKLLISKIHEERTNALFILVYNYQKHPEKREEIFNFYLKNTRNINNWDLVDLSAYQIVGEFLSDIDNCKKQITPLTQLSICKTANKGNIIKAVIHKDKSILYKLALSENIWERRIAIISTFYFIKNNKFDETIKISEMLLNDKHDLIHKAVGCPLHTRKPPLEV